MCLDDQILNTYLDGELAEPWKSQVEEHLRYCQACRDRYETLSALKNKIKNSVLPESEIKASQAKILRSLENTCLKKKKNVSFFNRQFTLKAPQLASAAAAFVFVFVGAIILASSGHNDFIPEINDTVINQENVNLVANTEKSLGDYSIEELVDSLESRGFTVELHSKTFEPVNF